MENKVRVNLDNNSYDIFIGKNILSDIYAKLKNIYNGNKVFIITDNNVAKLYLSKLTDVLNKNKIITDYYIIKAGEESKSLETAEKIYTSMLKARITKSDLIIALGGGVVGDVAGFAAATYLRGVPYIQIPTSLLAQVDSSVGGKVAVNLKEGKNLVGNFYQPKMVLIDTEVLSTLPKRNYKEGLAEIIKYALIEDKSLFERLASYKNLDAFKKDIADIIKTCVKIKADIVSKDEKDRGERMKLNLGHTLAHGIETSFGYGNYSHGEAVAIGMYEITKKSEEDGFTKKDTAKKIKDILIKYELEYDINAIHNQKVISHIKNDKKNEGDALNIILLRDIGKSEIYKTTLEYFR